MFWAKKKKDESTIYGTLNQRLFAALIDLFILIVIWTPLERIVITLIYNNTVSPRQKFAISLEQKLATLKDSAEQIEPNFVLSSFSEFIEQYGIWNLMAEQFIALFILLAFTLFFWITKQATPGKMLLRLKIVDNITLQPPTIAQYIIRLFSYALSILPLGLGILFIAINKKKHGWHDLIAGTSVIRVAKKKNAT